jgi:general secretion pathway protein I
MNYLSQNRNIKNGFTLIEVVVGLAILGVGLMVIIELFAGGLRLGRVSEEYTKAVNYSRMKLEELALKPPAEEGVEEGEFNETYRWKIETKRIDLLPFERDTDFKPPVEFFHVKIDVIWKSGLKERSVGLESYRTIKLKSDEKKS